MLCADQTLHDWWPVPQLPEAELSAAGRPPVHTGASECTQSAVSSAIPPVVVLQQLPIMWPLRVHCRHWAVLQALNNWGLVLQELSSMRPPAERHYLVQHSVAKFHRAVRLRPDFDRACYNLGTVLYAYACALQSDASQHLSSQLTQASACLRVAFAAGRAAPAFL